ncbi:uncharacterized protein DFL_002263 [Arthrobotrys flagrans]|uniref:Uncharacterized protein n=1 Tax=Arthrobotrys flagrans TaxID=97331 RepID=A0A437A9Z1_ARTFL|nr:hypothetical protein DFL_002263 [Arthrobotrys flagrans]
MAMSTTLGGMLAQQHFVLQNVIFPITITTPPHRLHRRPTKVTTTPPDLCVVTATRGMVQGYRLTLRYIIHLNPRESRCNTPGDRGMRYLRCCSRVLSMSGQCFGPRFAAVTSSREKPGQFSEEWRLATLWPFE